MTNQDRLKRDTTVSTDTASVHVSENQKSPLPSNTEKEEEENEVHRFRKNFLDYMADYTQNQNSTPQESDIRGLTHRKEAPSGIFSKQWSLRSGSNCIFPTCGVEAYIAEWVSNLVEGLDDVRKNNIELEFKLGILTDKFLTRHVKFAIPCVTVVDPAYAYKCTRFHSQVPGWMFLKLQSMLASLDSSTFTGKVHREDFVEREETHPDNVRLAYDSDNTVIRVMEKIHIGNLVIVNPKSGLDLRLTLSTKRPIAFEPSMTQALHVRNKLRKSWIMNSIRIDTTSVESEHDQTKEIEVEFDPFIGYNHQNDTLKKFTDTIRFALEVCWNLTRDS